MATRNRVRVTNVRMSEFEHLDLRTRAAEFDMTLSEYLRAAGMGAVRARPLGSAPRPRAEQPRPPRPVLRVIAAPAAAPVGTMYELPPPGAESQILRLAAGDPPEDAIALPDRRVSSRHAVVRTTTRGHVQLRDAGSTNGTKVLRAGGLQARQVPSGREWRLAAGDTVIVGDTQLLLELVSCVNVNA